MMKKIFLLLLISALLIACGNQNRSQEKENDVQSTHPEWVYNAVIYEVNTRQYTPEGTFNAFSAHLPRLEELGVDILWFMPVQSIGEEDRKGLLGSYYSIKNYTEINNEFGTLADFKAVVKQAQGLGMKVILDWVANHTSRDALWVDTHPDWYVRDSLGNLNVMYDWTDIAQLDYSVAEMREEMIEAMKFWIRETGIDGFRCDVAGEIPTDFWEAAKDSLTRLNPDIFMLAEAEKPALNESVFDAYYAWDFHHKMNNVAQGKETVDSLRVSLQRMNDRFPPHAIPMYFTSNHDENSWNGTEFERMGEAAKSFAVLTYMLPGIPLVYSGQEVGLNRRLEFFEKDIIEWEDKGGFSDFYKELNRFKRKNKALLAQERDGEMTEIPNDCTEKVWSFKRVNNGNEVVCVFNFSNETVNVQFNGNVPGEGFSSFPDTSQVLPVEEMELKPWEYRIYSK
ncbi:Glycosidase [Porphyromonadaceae bacterium NLAE-zl-C104]|uniref:alpha-amylase family glycosyl hydrolase n=1 Tax=Proteiniphilum TaxID=294702 RepID=UPI0008DFA2AC|nr:MULTISPECIES: alpha-amylase family glycosyl hydrolase [Proteiniphilum]MDY9918136.1 alpha-amylase family glycosyl hydrolase [Proteiniphilum sp.]SFS29763.1 Glycosidase [Porphyromonadaceae bacterium NLAE-zl-C104]